MTKFFDDGRNDSTDELESSYVRKRCKTFSYNIKLPNVVKDEYTWNRLLHFLREMREDDDLTIECSGYGGEVQIGSNFLNSLSRCKAKSKIKITGDCWSMHSLIASYLPEITEIDNLAHLMFHNMSHVSWGKVNETIDQAEFYKEWMPKFLDLSAGKILTKEEIKSICNGKDIYLSPFQYRQRQEAYLNRLNPPAKKRKK